MKTWLKALIGAIVVLVVLLAIGATQIGEEEGAEEFKLQNFVFASQKPEGYMRYTEQPDATYSPGDTVWMYVNVKGATYNKNPDETKEVWLTCHLKVVNPDGYTVVDQEVVNEHRNWPEEKDMNTLYFRVYWTLPSVATPGKYTVTLTGTDKLADKTNTVSSNFTVG